MDDQLGVVAQLRLPMLIGYPAFQWNRKRVEHLHRLTTA